MQEKISIEATLQDEIFMRQALFEAKIAFEKGEVPVGAVVVFNGEILARAHNRVEEKKDASAHAEMLALKEAAKKMDNWRLLEATLYSTLEPCSMCAGALILSRVKRVVWGAPDFRHGADGSFIELLQKKHPIHELQVTSGVLKDEAAELMRQFFQKRREEAKLEALFDELISLQKSRVRKCAEEVVPKLTDDDLLQPNDFPELENHPYFRYEEGVLEGLLSARMAFLAREKKEE